MQPFVLRLSLSVVALVCASGAFATSIPSTLLGVPRTVRVSLDSGDGANLISVPGQSSGGSFAAQIPSGATNQPFPYAIWCVDSQNQVSNNQSYNASIISLASISANSNIVRYGNVTGSGWTLNLGSGFDNATTRYRMAAALIQQYKPIPPDPLNNLDNAAIQLAIWQIMDTNPPAIASNNNTSSVAGAPGSGTVIGVNAAATTWVNWAKNNMVALNAKWAVISGALNGGSTGFTSPAVQTFLVQFTGEDLTVPEPGFYAVLSIGLVALFSIARRRRLTV